ncbi:DUF3369 domain-containing protein [Rhodoferax sp. 4810]|uniref:DUF3369 domain-containing protein n=1 Tax=Thiospirillum jenense TaxID=1653858 RepID=A0A839H5T3_9GAMM|nr:response regulator [Thiospirillum jenense]MBB1074191.1 DUF3369 domain-containing protein [Rhodoferax jenense]MBB1125265.1 DUF3369 domain-containing protein [Thiospirillum jenense]
MSVLKFKKRDEEVNAVSSVKTYKKWKILIVDDEVEVHNVTKRVLKNFDFEENGLEFISAYSGKECLEQLKTHTDIAIILLDVVMETDDAGLNTARAIRQELNNKMVRIVLRTGQPGSAPETDVIKNYDINDYKEKTELTTQKLYTTVMTSLRSFRDLQTIQQNRIGLEKIIESSRNLLTFNSAKLFSEGVLTQILAILKRSPSSVLFNAGDAFIAHKVAGGYQLVVMTGCYTQQTSESILTPDVCQLLDETLFCRENLYKQNVFVGYMETSQGEHCLIYLPGCATIDTTDRKLLDVFMSNITVMYENLLLNSEIINTQKEIIERLGEVVEYRSHDTARHVYRVAQVSYILAHALGFNEQECEMIRMASPMHDVGKVSTPDAILLKSGKLTDEEFAIIKEHAQIGYEIMGKSDREIFKTAAIIAHEHHEKWDGTGYPRGLKGDEIHLYGRITAIADVFDALSQKRVYKEPWPLERILELIKEEKGRHFDPRIVDLFFENLDEILEAIKEPS